MPIKEDQPQTRLYQAATIILGFSFGWAWLMIMVLAALGSAWAAEDRKNLQIIAQMPIDLAHNNYVPFLRVHEWLRFTENGVCLSFKKPLPLRRHVRSTSRK